MSMITDITERKRRETISEAIGSINQIIHSTLDFDEIMQKTVSEAAKITGSETAAISLREGESWIVRYIYGFPEDVIGTEMNDDEERHAVLAIKTKKPVAIDDAFNDERVNRSHMKRWGVRSVLVVPLIVRGKVIGVLFFNYHKSNYTFDNIDIDFAIQLASSISLALENSRLFESLKIELSRGKQEEYRVRRYNLILEGINRIFGSVVKAESEEQLAISCLSVALDVTDSQIGFISLVGDDGLLHDIAISDMGWEQCLMQDKIGHRRSPGDFVLHGLYGHVINSGKGFFTNDPPAHPDSIGLPQGHPLLTSFLGVPLTQDGKTIGLIAVANREGSYSCEQEQDLETIAPAMMQALQRKREEQERIKAEEALKKARDTLEEKVKKRTAELEKAYKSLKESEKSLAEAQEMAHIGHWEWEIATDKSYWSDELFSIFGRNPEEPYPTYKDFLSYVHPDDRGYVNNAANRAINGKPYSIDYRIISAADGEERTVNMQSQIIFDEKNTPVRIKGIVQDVTERKKAEEALERMDKVRIKEIHHRIKNNLQVISSLLDLQAEKFEEEKVKEAFREGQNRVISMSLIHEELYRGEGTDTLDFSVYLKKLAEDLFQTYNLSSKNISLNMYLEENTFLDMDTAVPLGIIVNELVSNSLKHAFIDKQDGEIRIKLCREEKNIEMNKSLFNLTISDNGKGLPEDLKLEFAESLGLQLVNILVDQLDGELELNRVKGTKFNIKFKAVEKDNQAQVGLKSQENG